MFGSRVDTTRFSYIRLLQGQTRTTNNKIYQKGRWKAGREGRMQLSGKGDVESFSVERCRMFCGDPRLGHRNPALQIVSSSSSAEIPGAPACWDDSLR